MPLTVNVGITRKLGQPGYSSLGASCHLEVELDAGLIDDPETLQSRIHRAYASCSRAVREELDRLTRTEAPSSPPLGTAAERNGPGSRSGPGRTSRDDPLPERTLSSRHRPVRPASAPQVQALWAIARHQGADLQGLIQDEHGVTRPEELSSAQASKLIDTLKAAAQV